MIAAQKALPREKGGGLNRGAAGGGKKSGPRGSMTDPRDCTPKLSDMGINKHLADSAQSGPGPGGKGVAGMPPLLRTETYHNLPRCRGVRRKRP